MNISQWPRWVLAGLAAVAIVGAFALISTDSGTLLTGDRPATQEAGDFHWPEGKRGALSLSFDDARLSQPDVGLPILDSYGVKATFYVSVNGVQQRLDEWKGAVAQGHEIANHSLTHPCSGNFAWAREKALESYTLEMMAHELDEGNAAIERLLGVRPTTFAYPCGQTFVGRGAAVKSYVPLVAERFAVGRGWLDEEANDPAFCDLAQVMGMELDGLDFQEVKSLVQQAVADGRWLILCGHEIGEQGPQTSRSATLKALCEYALDPANGIWIAPVQEVAQYILEQRAGGS